jgi:hypothetical protein
MLIPDIRNEYRHGNWMLAFVFLALALVPLVANFAGSWRNGVVAFHLPACSVLQHTGKLCASCGLTRSVVAFYRGDFALSHAWHPAGSLLVMLIFLQLLFRVVYLAENSAWLPWIDIGQLLLTGLLFRYALIGNAPFWVAHYGWLAFLP